MSRKKQRPQKGVTAPSEPNSKKSIGAELAQFISERHERILLDWEEAVRRDRAVPSADKLTRRQLTDHIPELLTSLSLTLSEAFDQQVAGDITYTAAMHGQIRWQQDYDVSELLREIGHLRTALIHQLSDFRTQTPNFGDAPGEVATVIVHSYLDKLMRRSVEQFIAISERTKPKE